MKKRIKDLIESKKICSIYLNGFETDKFIAGYIKNFDENFVLVQCIDPYGNYDGYLAFLFENIIKIEIADKYLLDIELLSKENIRENIFTETINDVIYTLVIEAMEKGKICSFELCESGRDDICGFVKDVTNDFITVKIVNEYGERNGETVFEINKISSMSFASIEDQKKEKLLRIKKQKGSKDNL